MHAEALGASSMNHLREFSQEGALLKDIPLAEANKRWQHPWHLVHRVALHEKLKTVATSQDGPGFPARLHVSSKVVDIDPERGIVTTADGATVHADVIVGADGIYVRVFHLIGPVGLLTRI
jgi:2-polyprenyl-6-methoxyphenol hydroxylase-like FAD-dependent oxidoreductase